MLYKTRTTKSIQMSVALRSSQCNLVLTRSYTFRTMAFQTDKILLKCIPTKRLVPAAAAAAVRDKATVSGVAA